MLSNCTQVHDTLRATKKSLKVTVIVDTVWCNYLPHFLSAIPKKFPHSALEIFPAVSVYQDILKHVIALECEAENYKYLFNYNGD